jgi:thiamine biosynthesis lipoprotein
MGSNATITLVGGSQDLLDLAFGELERLEARWSRFRPGSDISRLNTALGETVDVDPATVALLHAMRSAAAETEGAFDPTLLPVLVAAGYAASRVDPAEVTWLPPESRSGGDLAAVSLDGTSVRLPVGMAIDPGGIGKGLAADLLVRLLREEGAAGAMVEIGGDLVVDGDPPDSVAWSIAIEDPHAPAERIDTVRIVAGAVATSSTLKRRWKVEHEERHHIMDPRTGISAVTTVASSTVIADSGARAEALAKLAVVRSVREALERLPLRGAAGLVVLHDGSRRETENWGVYR